MTMSGRKNNNPRPNGPGVAFGKQLDTSLTACRHAAIRRPRLGVTRAVGDLTDENALTYPVQIALRGPAITGPIRV